MDADSLPVEFLGVPVRVSGYLEPDLAAKLGEAGFIVLDIATVEFVPREGPAESQILAFCRR